MRSAAVRQTLTRRDLLRGLSATGMLAVEAGRPENTRPSDFFPSSQAGSTADESKRWKGSALGNLYPFVKHQQEKTHQTLAFLHHHPQDLDAWKAKARTKVFELMSYRPEVTTLRPRILERVDKGNYVP